jgi:hypothetical protein
LEVAGRKKLPLRFLIFGDVDPVLPEELSSSCTVIRSSGPRELTTEVCRWRPHLAWFPYQSSVTYGFELTDAQGNGLPIAASAIGAIPERLQGRALSWLLPPESPAEDWVALFLRLRREGMTTQWSVPADAPGLPDDHRVYEHYLYSLL